MASTPTSDPPTSSPQPPRRHRSSDYESSLSDLREFAANYQNSSLDYMDTLRSAMATFTSIIDFYDPSGVLTSQPKSTPTLRDDARQLSTSQDAQRAYEHSPSLLTSSEAPAGPPGLSSQTEAGYENRELTANDILTLTQSLKDQAAEERPLVAKTVPLSVLYSEYTSPTFLSKIRWLAANGWTGLRRSRGDGDCFYRSMAFAYVERIMDAEDQAYAAATSLSTIERRFEDLKTVGFEPIVFEDFFDVLKELIVNIVQPDANGNFMTPLSLLERFQDPFLSNSVVVFFRLLTSAHIRLHADDFAPFLFDPETFEPIDISRFCESQVEATGREADHPQIQALTSSLKVAVDIAYVDGSVGGAGHGPSDGQPDGKVDFVRFETEGSDGANPITLLYRPGHYDILEKKASVHGESFAR